MTAPVTIGDATLYLGNSMERLAEIPEASCRCCVTSPPYWGLRDYGVDGQLGLEATPEEYVAKMVQVFRAVRRVLADDGTLWVVLGDSYIAQKTGHIGSKYFLNGGIGTMLEAAKRPTKKTSVGLKNKDLVGIPWRVAFALQADGWWLRSDIIWAKPNPMPESVRDRPTKAHEYLFLLAKAERYYYDAGAIREVGTNRTAGNRTHKYVGTDDEKHRTKEGLLEVAAKPWAERNRRSVWTIPTQPFPEAHFATFPEALVEPCILAGSAEGDAVLDPFAGSGTVGVVAHRLRRRFVGVELSPDYLAMAQRRIGEAQRQGRLELGGTA